MKRTIIVTKKLNLQTTLHVFCMRIWVGLDTSSHDLSWSQSPKGVVPWHLAETNTPEAPQEKINDPQAS